jgi:peroxin-3
LETERITFELQQQKAAKLAKNGDVNPPELGSAPPSATDDDGRSTMSLQSAQRTKKSKLQLWNDLKISCE